MKLIKTSTGQYPYGLEELRQDYPHTSFPNTLGYITPLDFDCAEVTTDAPPEYDPQTHYIKEADYPTLIDGKWRLAVEVLPIPTPVSPPNWGAFNAAMLADVDFNAVYATVNATRPLLASSVPAAFVQVATQGIETFSLIFDSFCTIGSATPEQRLGWSNIARDSNLPQEFIATIATANN